MFLNLQFTDEETEFHEHSRLALDHVSHPRQNRNWNLYQLLGTLCHIPGWRRALSLTEQLPLSWYCRLFWNAACYWAELRLHYCPSCSIFGLRRTRNWVHPSFPKRVVSAFYVVRFLFKKKWKLCQQHTNAQIYLLDYISPLFYSILFEPWRTGLRKHKC